MVESNPRETILVTGATGLVGSQVLEMLDAERNRIIGIARNVPDLSSQSIQWVSCDLLDVIALDNVLRGVDKVYHCAGFVSFDPKLKKTIYKINVEGTANLVNACIKNGIHKLLHVSSVAAIGEARTQKTVIHEKLEWNDRGISDYGKSKYLAEIEVWRGLCEGLPSVMINPSIVIGCGDWNSGSTAMFKSVYDGFPWYTEGIHGFVDVRDVAKASIALMESDIVGERFIVNGANISYKALFDQIADSFGKPRPNKKVTPFLAEIVWRVKYLKSKITGSPSILNKNTARTALAVCEYDSSKLKKALPDFNYTTFVDTIDRTCKALIEKYGL